MSAYNPGPGFRRGNRRFGRQAHPIAKKVTGHVGDDCPAPEGTPIPAAYAGEVKEIRTSSIPPAVPTAARVKDDDNAAQGTEL